jgi:hypothetical protein
MPPAPTAMSTASRPPSREPVSRTVSVKKSAMSASASVRPGIIMALRSVAPQRTSVAAWKSGRNG